MEEENKGLGVDIRNWGEFYNSRRKRATEEGLG